MQEPYSNKHFNDSDDQIDFQEILYALWKEKLIIVSITAFVTIVGVIYSLFLPNIYESKAILAPVNSSSSISGALRGYTGIAGLAGISIPSGVDDGNTPKAIEKISTLSFFKNSILKNIHLPDLMAVKSWDKSTNTLIYDETIYQIKTNAWVKGNSYAQKHKPTAQDSFRKFTAEYLSISEDKNSGFITLSIKHQSPFIAKQWVELVVNEINTFYRLKDKSESVRAVNYLNKQISMTGLSEIKQVIADLLQEETKKLTLIEANQFYVLDYIDPPAVMERKSEPQRSLISILSAILGGMLSIFLVLMKHYFFQQKNL